MKSNNYILGSHNSWSYLKPKKWWMRPFAFVARCQSKSIVEQYTTYGVRCFDLRVRWNDNGEMVIAHGLMEYKYTREMLDADLRWLNAKKDCYVRVLHEVRNEKQYTMSSIFLFKYFCELVVKKYTNIHFWCGRNLYNWEYDYHFSDNEPTCTEKYSSVCPPKYLDDWFPWLYAKLNNVKIRKQGTADNILMVDFVNHFYR